MLLINFGDAGHLKIDEVVPPSATRRMSETRSNTEAFQLPLLVSEGLAPQLLKVQFAYFLGAAAVATILISVLLLGLGNTHGAAGRRAPETAFPRRSGRACTWVAAKRRAERKRDSVEGALERIRVGRRASKGAQAVWPRGEEQARVPAARRGRWCTAVRRWCPTGGGRLAGSPRSATGDVEDNEVQIDFERDRVHDIQARVPPVTDDRGAVRVT